METVKFSRCRICTQAASVADLEPNAADPGLVCVDKSACRKRVAESQERGEKEKQEPTGQPEERRQ